eukprot:613829-Ditylum_brightwellii.AAC.1
MMKQVLLFSPDETIGLVVLAQLWNQSVPRRIQQISHNLLTPLAAILAGYIPIYMLPVESLAMIGH